MLTATLIFLVSVNNLSTVSAAATKYSVEDALSTKSDSSVPEACKHLTYCTVKPRDYPEEKFNEMFKGYSVKQRIRREVSDDEVYSEKAVFDLKNLPQPALITDIQFENRLSDPDEDSGCESIVTFEPLYKVRDKRNEEWRIVVQAPSEDFVQRVRLETCKNKGSPCFTDFSEMNTAFCKQKYNTWKILVAQGHNQTEQIEATLPVCCSCYFKPALAFANRFGGKDKP